METRLNQEARITRKEQEKENRKHDILEIAAKIFSEKGFHNTTMDDIAERVGLAKGTIYLYYENKENLFFSILMNKARALHDRLESAINEEPEFYPCFKRFVESFLMFFHENEDFMRIIQSDKGRISPEKHYEFHDYSQQELISLFGLHQKLIELGQKQNILRKGKTIALAKTLMGTLYAYSFHHVFMGVESSITQDADQIADLFIHGAAVKK
jgi:AcrR family transcriptional regulator